MKRFIRKKLRRWLGITKLFNDIRVINHLIKSLDDRMNTLNDLINALDVALEHHTKRIMELEDKQVRLEQAFYKTIDEDVSAEVQWNVVKGNDNDK